MGGSCKGGCLEDAKAGLASRQVFGVVGWGKKEGCLACLLTHWVSNSTIEMESSNGSSGLATVALKCFVMDSGHMDFDSIAGS